MCCRGELTNEVDVRIATLGRPRSSSFGPASGSALDSSQESDFLHPFPKRGGISNTQNARRAVGLVEGTREIYLFLLGPVLFVVAFLVELSDCGPLGGIQP